MTRAIEVTTAAVVERPTSSAPAPVEKPSLHPTAVMTRANSSALDEAGVDVARDDRVSRRLKIGAEGKVRRGDAEDSSPHQCP